MGHKSTISEKLTRESFKTISRIRVLVLGNEVIVKKTIVLLGFVILL